MVEALDPHRDRDFVVAVDEELPDGDESRLGAGLQPVVAPVLGTGEDLEAAVVVDEEIPAVNEAGPAETVLACTVISGEGGEGQVVNRPPVAGDAVVEPAVDVACHVVGVGVVRADLDLVGHGGEHGEARVAGLDRAVEATPGQPAQKPVALDPVQVAGGPLLHQVAGSLEGVAELGPGLTRHHLVVVLVSVHPAMQSTHPTSGYPDPRRGLTHAGDCPTPGIAPRRAGSRV